MPLFRRRRKAASVPVEVAPRLVEILRTFDGTLGSYGTVYRQLAPVRTVVDFLADAVSTTSLKVHRRTASGRPEVRDHPLSVLLRHPNPELTTERLVAGTVRDVAVYGMAYWRKIERGTQKWVVPLPPYRVIPRGGDLLAPSRFDLQIPGQPPVTLSRDEVVLFRTYDPEDRRVGASKLEALRTILAEEVEVSRHRREFWRNAARREGVIKRPLDAPPWSEDARDRFRESWRGRTAGTRNAGLTGILEEGMDWVPDSFSPKESEFVEGRKFILEATARVFNLQVALLGLTETATFASQKEFSKS
ncbi:MAG: phage portal protein, partial [Chloroflexota bacterium]